MYNIYFNQWFSSIAWVIKDIKESLDAYIVGSSRNKYHAYREYVDTFIVEDWNESKYTKISMRNYVDFCINICKKYDINIFFVKKHSKYIMKNQKEFDDIGVTLICENINTLDLLSNKSNVYDILNKENRLQQYIPSYTVSNNGNELLQLLSNNFGKNNLILKFNEDEGGASFRAINDDMISYKSLYKFRVNEITTPEAVNIINSIDDKSRIIIMEKLDSPEISVDCYNSKNGFIAICRNKEDSRVEKIYFNKEIYNICKIIAETLNLRYPFNVQFRYKHNDDNEQTLDNLRILEINPRISGGIYYEILENKNIAKVCILDAICDTDKYNIVDYVDFKTTYNTHLEMPIHLEV